MAVRADTPATCKEVKEFLMNSAERLSGKGTQMAAWRNVVSMQNESYSEIYPSLYLGDSTIARSPKKLTELGVTHVVNCACGTGFNMVDTSAKNFQTSGIQFYGIPAKDIWKFQLTPYFDETANFIESALVSNGKVYVHCVSGVSRSATVVLAFLMLKQGMWLLEAVQTVRKRRTILPNDGFLRQLVDLDKRLIENRHKP